LVQPFIKKVLEGEIRSIYYSGQGVGSIIKVPPKGSYLANIAQGATFEKVELSKAEKTKCDEFSIELLKQGVPWVAFDILDEKISEANTTCPGLLVEVSKAYRCNLGEKIISIM
jgi:glutathione synthase